MAKKTEDRKSTYETQVTALGIAIQAEQPIHIQSGPGQGKTKAVNAVGKALERHVETIIASLREPADFGGYPVPSTLPDGTRTLEFLPPASMVRLAQRKGIGFLDEVTCTSPRTQAALLRVVNENVCGELSMDGVSWVLASNPADQASGGFDITGPLANRIIHLRWSLEAETWCNGMVNGFSMPEIPRLAPDWKKEIPAARGLVSAFIHTFPQKLTIMPKSEAEWAGAWPSPRTWDITAILMAACKSAGVSGDVMTELIIGCVGTGVGIEFLTWFRDLDMPNPEDILKDPENFKLPTRTDKAYAVLTAVTAAVIGNLTPARWKAGLTVLVQAAKQGSPDVAAAACKQLALNRPPNTPAPAEAMVFLPLLQKAGMFPSK